MSTFDIISPEGYPVFLADLPNIQGAGKPFHQLVRDEQSLQKFIATHDKPGRAIYHTVAILKEAWRCKETVVGTRWIWAETDFKDHPNITPEDILRRIHQSPRRPNMVVFSGHGLHEYWRLSEMIDARIGSGAQKELEEVLRLAAGYVGGDSQVAEAARLMRLPGSHNTRFEGENILVEIVHLDELSWELDDLRDFFLEARPILPPPVKPEKKSGNGAAHDEPPEWKPVDVEAATETVSYGDPDHSINATYKKVAGARLRRGDHPDEVLNGLVDMAMAESGRLGKNWSRDDEVRGMRKRILSTYNNLLLKGWDAATMGIPSWLPGELHQQWMNAVLTGKRPVIGFNRAGFIVKTEATRSQGTQQGKEGETPQAEAPQAEAPQAEAPQQEPPGKEEPQPPPPKYRFKLLRYCDLRPGVSDEDYLIDELLPAEGIVVVWGKFKSLKTFVMYDMMLHVAKGWEYRGRATRQGTVVYCAFEGAHGFPKRTEAQRRHYKFDDDVPLYVMAYPTNLIKDHTRLIAEIRHQLQGPDETGAADGTLAVFVLDTLNRSLVGSEGKDADMAAYIAAASAIREAFRCLVIIVHHCGWDETRPRGHSSLPGAVDGQFAITREGDAVTLLVELLRDGPEGAEIHSMVKTVEVGVDAQGKVLTSLAVVPTTGLPKSSKLLWPKGLEVLRKALATALHTRGEDHQFGILQPLVRAVSMEHVRTEFNATYAAKGDTPAQRADSKKHAFKRKLDKAQQLELIGLRETEGGIEMVWFPTPDATEADQ